MLIRSEDPQSRVGTNDDLILQACFEFNAKQRPKKLEAIGLTVHTLVLLTDDANLRLKARAKGVATRDHASFEHWFFARPS